MHIYLLNDPVALRLEEIAMDLDHVDHARFQKVLSEGVQL